MSAFERGAISLGDLAIALKELHPSNPAEAARIASTLGFGLADQSPALAKHTAAWDAVRSPGVEEPPAGAGPTEDRIAEIDPMRLARAVEPSPVRPAPEPQPGFRTRLEELSPAAELETREPPDWVLSATRLELTTPTGIDPPKRAPLFAANKSRALFSAAVATRAAEGPLNVSFLVRLLAERRHLSRFPRLPVATLRCGIQLLTDRSEAMTPFLDDFEDLEESLRKTVGRDRVWSARFVGIPRLSSGASRGRRLSAQLRSGVPVLLATDFGMGAPLGIGESVGLTEWQAFAECVRQAGLPVIALVPVHPRAWPAELSRWFTMIHWDRYTTAGDVRRAVGPGHPLGA